MSVLPATSIDIDCCDLSCVVFLTESVSWLDVSSDSIFMASLSVVSRTVTTASLGVSVPAYNLFIRPVLIRAVPLTSKSYSGELVFMPTELL